MPMPDARPGPVLADRPDKADKRDAILRAAIDVFAARGFFNAQVADVAREAGVAAGTVYLYFHGKDDLLISIFERTMKAAVAAGRESLAVASDPIERLRAIARLHLDRLGSDRRLAVVFQVELRQSTKFMERFSTTHLREYLGIIRDVIAEGQATGQFRRGINPTLAAKLFFGALDEMATNWILSRRRYALVSEVEPILDLFIGGVAAPFDSRDRSLAPFDSREPRAAPFDSRESRVAQGRPFDSRESRVAQGRPFDSRDRPLAQGRQGRPPRRRA
jgi:TetR/AcrR family transcriptional regulator, fatty acid metabolism regulator protein